MNPPGFDTEGFAKYIEEQTGEPCDSSDILHVRMAKSVNPNIEIWNDIALIKDDAYFTKWVKETGKLAHHDGFLNYLRPYLGGVMLDIGANIGTHSIYYAQFGVVHCFEPNPIAFECLEHNLRNHVPERNLHPTAVGAHPGTISMSPPGGGNYGAVFTEPGTDIPVITIDSLNLSQVNYMKIDVEGDELLVLEGAKETIQTHRPVICIESNPHTLSRKNLTPKDLVQAIHSLGYTCKQRVPEDISCDLLCEPS
jgi:FkbM family methyltransferase